MRFLLTLEHKQECPSGARDHSCIGEGVNLIPRRALCKVACLEMKSQRCSTAKIGGAEPDKVLLRKWCLSEIKPRTAGRGHGQPAAADDGCPSRIRREKLVNLD